MAANQDGAQASGDPHGADARRKTIYRVVVNHEEQYTIWPIDRDLPLRWRDAGSKGTQDECTKYIRDASGNKHPHN